MPSIHLEVSPAVHCAIENLEMLMARVCVWLVSWLSVGVASRVQRNRSDPYASVAAL